MKKRKINNEDYPMNNYPTNNSNKRHSKRTKTQEDYFQNKIRDSLLCPPNITNNITTQDSGFVFRCPSKSKHDHFYTVTFVCDNGIFKFDCNCFPNMKTKMNTCCSHQSACMLYLVQQFSINSSKKYSSGYIDEFSSLMSMMNI